MIDTHTHIYDSEAYTEGSSIILERAVSKGVNKFILPNVNEESVAPLLNLHLAHPECTYVAVGLHPCDAKENWKEQLECIMAAFSGFTPVAIGEVGIDLYWNKDTLSLQQDVLEAQISIARKRKLPLIIHCRDAFAQTVEILKSCGHDVPAVFHSFTGDIDDVRKIREVGDYYFGINGVVTYKNAPKLREALHEIGIERILLETDAPYLPPVPYRGRRNESSYIGYVRDAIAANLHISSEEVENTTDNNATLLFGL